ncbi:bifunctional metallophosphatase/5'-nucleotidase [Enterococcus sp. LJL99]
MEEIIIFHTNDLHSHLENWPKIRRYLNQKKKLYEAENKTVLTLDLGDFVDRWHPLTEASDGQANVELMNQVAYDAATIGNNEGVGNSKEQLNHLYDEASFDVILGNLFDPITLKRPEWAKKYKIIETPNKMKLALIALTAPFPLTYEPNGWTIRTMKEVLPELIKEVQKISDGIILMSHLGIDDDLNIANIYPEINVILGSHTHHLFRYGEKVNQTQLSAAGKFGRFVGEVHLWIEDGEIVKSTAEAIPTEEFEETETDKKEVENYLILGHRLLIDKKVAIIPETLTVDLHNEKTVMSMAIEALKEKGQTEVAILNSGLFLADLPAGVVNEDMLHSTLPHPMHLIKVTLKGADLIRLIKEMEKNRQYLRKFPIVGMGFRGKIFGDLYYGGLTYQKKTKDVLWLGNPVDLNENYTFTTVDHLMFIPFFPTIEIAGKVEFLFPEFIRNVVSDYLAEHYPIQ